jgi:hypothetical protein
LNGDGKLDIATADHHTGEVSVLAGDGRGAFAAPANYPAGLTPTALAAADFDGDGRIDLLAANYGSGSVTRLLGDGKGGFGGVLKFATGARPYGLAAGDLDADGVADIVVADSGSADLQIFAGDGRGGLRAPLKVAAGTRPRGVAVADFDGDGRPDIAVADSGAGKVLILLNECADGAGGARATAGDGKGANVLSNTLPAGQWGGQHARLEVTEAGATVEFDCGYGTIDERIVTRADGGFSARGTYEGETGGPSHDISAVDESGSTGARASGEAARYTGRVAGRTLTLTVTLADAGAVVGTFTLSRGSAGRLFKCLK